MEENTVEVPQNTSQFVCHLNRLSPGAKNWAAKILVIILGTLMVLAGKINRKQDSIQ